MMGKAIRQGILWTFLGVFPAALMVGLLFRFPVPFRGYVSGWNSLQEGPLVLILLLWTLPLAAAFFTIQGGFIVLTILGIIAGMIGWKVGKADRANHYARNVGIGMAFGVALVLSVLDKIVGPW